MKKLKEIPKRPEMKIAALVKTIRNLPEKDRYRLFNSLGPSLEDYLLAKIASDRLRNPPARPMLWEYLRNPKPGSRIPARERWLFKDKNSLKSVLTGIRQSAEGKAGRFRSFAKYAKDKLD